MKKILLSVLLISLLFSFSLFSQAQAKECPGQTGIVRCGQQKDCQCEISDFLSTIGRIYNFIVWDIATPLAVLALLVGGILMMVSAGNPNLAGLGRKTLMLAAIGLVLVFCSWLIINVILVTLTGKGLG